MKIGIDIDDTTFNTVNAMVKYGDIFEEERTGVKAKLNNIGLIKNRYYLEGIYGWDKPTKFDFFNKYYKNVLEECIMLPNANEVISKLRKEGHTIHFITARLMDIDGCDTEKITKNSLEKNGIEYDSLSLAVKYKKDFFEKNMMDICIEDSFETCIEAEELGMKSFLMTTMMNKSIDSGNITRVYSWDDVYREISNQKK